VTPFSYIRPTTVDEAVRELSSHPNAAFIAGGTNLVDCMKMGSITPDRLVDLNGLSGLSLTGIAEHNGGLRIGALVSNTGLANHALVRTRYPVLSQATLAGASPQLRNMASVGGNLLQRTRCYYFYDPSYTECNKRVPGSGCAALKGVNRIHAILGQSDSCIAVHPSDMCVALAALDAVVQVHGPKGARSIPFTEFHRLPGTTPHIETNLQAGELITAVDLPSITYARRSYYVKARDRHSYAFALVSVAAVIDLAADGTIRQAHLALGGVAMKPWRARKAEAALAGKKPDRDAIVAAANAELADARGYPGNAFKIELARRCIRRAVRLAAGREV
jgi:xanthine dehydrogenase YagS FAD-binding subunit